MNIPMGEASAPPPKDYINEDPPAGGTKKISNEHAEKTEVRSAQQQEKNVQADLENKKGDNSAASEQPKKASSSTCKPIATERPKIELPSHRINAQIQYMKYHAPIGKFIGYWPTEKALQGWITSK